MFFIWKIQRRWGVGTTPAALQGGNHVYIFIFLSKNRHYRGKKTLTTSVGEEICLFVCFFGKQTGYIKDFKWHFSRIFTFACPKCWFIVHGNTRWCIKVDSCPTPRRVTHTGKHFSCYTEEEGTQEKFTKFSESFFWGKDEIFSLESQWNAPSYSTLWGIFYFSRVAVHPLAV